MKPIRFNKTYFTRDKERDFKDDGAIFKCYLYKNKLPITVYHCDIPYYGGNSSIFCYIRIDYCGVPYHIYKNDDDILTEFNGCSDIAFNMEKLIENCEKIYKKYF